MYVRVRSGSSTTEVRIRKFILHRSGHRYCYKVVTDIRHVHTTVCMRIIHHLPIVVRVSVQHPPVSHVVDLPARTPNDGYSPRPGSDKH